MNKKITAIIIVILSITIGIALGYYLKPEKELSNDNQDNINVEIDANDENEDDSDNDSIIEDTGDDLYPSWYNETPIDNVTIKNDEIKTLYNYLKADLDSNNVCLGYFYQNPYQNHTLEDKISLVLTNYASNSKKIIDDNFLKKISQDERESIKNSSEYYIDANVVKNGMKMIFNIDIQDFDENTNYAWEYRSDADAFVQIMGGGWYDAEIVQQVVEYNELNNEINLTVVKAEILSISIKDSNGKTILPKGVYRYVNNANTLVFENNTKNFKFTKENVNNFPQLKYIFRKNNNGNYYLYDIINLNFKEDFENCD